MAENNDNSLQSCGNPCIAMSGCSVNVHISNTVSIPDNSNPCDRRSSYIRESITVEENLKKVLNQRMKDEYDKISSFASWGKIPEMRNFSLFKSAVKFEEAANLQNIFVDTDRRESERFVAILGGSGCGKSTLIRIYGKKVLDGQIENLKHIKIVYFVNGSELSVVSDAKTTFFEFMFSRLLRGAEISEREVEWLKQAENQGKILIVIDSVEQIKGMDLENSHGAITHNDLAKPSEIFYNLLRGNIFRGAKILAASRYHGIRRYKEDIQPQKTIRLVGLSKADSCFVFQHYVQQLSDQREMPKGDEIWENMPDSLKSLCSIPLVLYYVAGMAECPKHKQMQHVSSVMGALMETFSCVQKWIDKKDMFECLKKFCLDKMKNNVSVFSEDDLNEYNLQREDIDNLCHLTARQQRGIRMLHINKTDIYFSHKLIQETLACLRLLDLDSEECIKDLKRFIMLPEFGCVQQLICGFLSNEDTKKNAKDLIKHVDCEKKMRIFLEVFRPSDEMGPNEMLQYLASVNEMGGQMKQAVVYPSSIDLSGQILSKSSALATFPSIAGCKTLRKLILCGCGIDGPMISALWESLRLTEVTIRVLNLGNNPDIPPDKLDEIGNIMSHCGVEILNLHSCGLTDGHASTFLKTLERLKAPERPFKLKELILQRNPTLTATGLKYFATVVDLAKLDRLDIGYSDVTSNCLEKMMENTDLQSLQALILSSYKKDNGSRMQAVGRFVNKCCLTELCIDSSDLDHEDILVLNESLPTPLSLSSLNVSGNMKLCDDVVHQALCQLVQNHRITCMDIQSCGLSEQQRAKLTD